MPIVRAWDSETVEVDRSYMRGYATPKHGATEVVVFGAKMGPGAKTPLHFHDKEEVTWVLEGQLWVRIGDDEATIGPGDVIIVPPHALHRLCNMGRTPVVAMASMPFGAKFFTADGIEDTPPRWLE